MGLLARVLLFLTVSSALAQSPRTVDDFNSKWTFQKGDLAGAEQPGFDDSGWRKLSLPHDWAIEGRFDAKCPEGQGEPSFRPVRGGTANDLRCPLHRPIAGSSLSSTA